MTTSTRPEQRFASGISGKGGGRTAGGKAGEAGDTGPAPRRKGALFKSKKGILAVVALLAVGGGAYKFLAPVPPPGPPTGGGFVTMDATTLNLQGGHYLKLAVAIQLVKGKATPTSFASYEAAALTISEFSNRTVLELSTQAGRSRLTADLLAKLERAYPGEVYQVFLTEFVTQ